MIIITPQPPSYATRGIYPSVADGIKDIVICFDQGGGATCYAHVNARARRCPARPDPHGGGGEEQEFWIWQLPSTASCSEAYCTTYVPPPYNYTLAE
eukprot:COSAG06_NODE_2395_length_6958_cov_4.127132_7_plen_97_part_00